MTQPSIIAAPFAHQGNTVSRAMVLVMVALVPVTLFGLYQFGWPAINLLLVTVASAMLFEALCLKLMGKPVSDGLADGSAALSGWLLALTLPPWAPWWIGTVGAFLAIVVAKQIFGGLGQNLFNPAMVARVALLISFPVEMTRWVAPLPLGSNGAPDFLAGLGITFGLNHGFDAVSSASLLGAFKTQLSTGASASEALSTTFGLLDLGLGTVAGSLGETAAGLILAGGLLLLATRIITWHIPVAMLATVAIFSGGLYLLDSDHFLSPAYHLLSGATLLGAFFIATDYVTSPVTTRGQLLFGAGIGLLVVVIRTWTGYPEGMAFAVMLMNACVPLIDRYTRPRVFGRTRTGDPMEYSAQRLARASGRKEAE
ncbi:MAG: RnfABCDGE type electron transport complex subunit D [Magnetospiraceae bacterium]